MINVSFWYLPEVFLLERVVNIGESVNNSLIQFSFALINVKNEI